MNEEEQRQEALDELFSPDAPTEREKARLEKKREKARLKAEKKKAKGLNKKKKISDIFIEKKIPKEKRNNYPLLVDDNDNILWIPNIKKSKFNSSKNEMYDIIIKYCEKEENDEK